jgi:hypothetical protein
MRRRGFRLAAGGGRLCGALLLLVLAAGAASAQTRNVGPGVPDRPETAWPRPADEGFVLGGVVQGKQQVDIVGARDGRARYGLGSTEDLLAAWLLMPYGFALRGVARFEPAPRFAPDPPVRDHAAWIDELYLSWAGGPVDLFAGKIHPRFGASASPGTAGPASTAPTSAASTN